MYVLVAIAVVQDFIQTRISNRLILAGMGIALGIRIYNGQADQILWMLLNILLPVIVLYLFYLMGAIGAGDIKLFSLIGSYVNLRELVATVVLAFIFGAVISLGKMLYTRGIKVNLTNGGRYLLELVKGDLSKYPYRSEDNTIHFSLAIMLGLIGANLIKL